MPQRTALGDYLRARRELLRPQDVGLPAGGRRRVPGLRREELAMLAGISPNYYVRLEQGHDRRPSAQVVEALARALRLDKDATGHLYFLSYPGPSPGRSDDERPPFEEQYSLSEDGQRLIEIVGFRGGRSNGFTMSRVWDRSGQ